ncbi:hypothetical protein [Streptomyces sp. 184]|uniref:hypothetical protein n=1 Tax=Streptomyces sp. 184 TaxID=1827526 RepID=UPI0038911D66
MGPRSVLALTAATAALLLSPLSPVTTGAAAAQEPPPGRAFAPRCGDPGAGRFPVATALRGDGAALRAGGARRGLALRLHNVSDDACRDVHPVAVLSHEGGGRLRPDDIRLEFYDAAARRWRSVAFERTGAEESAGVFADGFGGFALPAGGSREVPVRLGFAAGAPTGRVTVNVTTVQRRGDDGEWVGQSDDYHVAIGRGRSCCGGTEEPTEPAAPTKPQDATERPAPPREGLATERPRRQPAEPGTPQGPPGAGEGRERGGPGTPDAPAERGTPGTPGTPGAPGAPGASETPGSPRGPVAPGAPTAPGAPPPPGAPGTAAQEGGPVPRWPEDVPAAPPRLPGTAPMPEGLADTGARTTAAAAGAAGSLLLGTALLLTSRRPRRTRP